MMINTPFNFAGRQMATPLHEAVDRFRTFLPPAKPPMLVAAEEHHTDARNRLREAQEALKDAAATFRAEQQRGWGMESMADVQRAQAKIEPLEAEVRAAREKADGCGEAWRRDYAKALDEAAKPLRAAIREHGAAALLDIEAACEALATANAEASNSRVGTSWLVRTSIEVRQRIANLRAILHKDAELARLG
ncbi:MAG: hypothetical protein JNK47_20260 [Mesorhizobium sp.]|nr:hypothetical protein [Mesorhizobium sp.]MBL8579545.1 hypothetical protein [Mesorhizobium sp.]